MGKSARKSCTVPMGSLVLAACRLQAGKMVSLAPIRHSDGPADVCLRAVPCCDAGRV
jgi:hypothetical protein